MTKVKAQVRAARERLAQLDSYPWEPVEAWVASVQPLFRAKLPTHLTDFAEASKKPRWVFLGGIVSGGGFFDEEPLHDTFAENHAKEDKLNHQLACDAKTRILAFLDGVLDVLDDEPDTSTRPDASAATDNVRSDPNQLATAEQEVLDLVVEFEASHVTLSAPFEDVFVDYRRRHAGATQEVVRSIALALRDRALLRYERDRYVERLDVTPDGLRASSRARAVAAFVAGWLAFFKREFNEKKGAFQSFTWADLKAARVVERDDEYPFATLVLRVLQLWLLGAGIANSPDADTKFLLPYDPLDIDEADGIESLVIRARRREGAAPAASEDAVPAVNIVRVELDPRERTVLDLIVDYQLSEGEPTPLAHVLLSAAPDQAAILRQRVEVLATKQCIEVLGFKDQETLSVTPGGLLVSGSATRCDAFATKLLCYLQARLSAEGVKFKNYKWSELVAAGVVANTDFALASTVVGLFKLSGGGGHGKGPPPFADWNVPPFIVRLREVKTLSDLYIFLGFQAATSVRSVSTGTSTPARDSMHADTKKVFIIHGRNVAARVAVEHFLKSLKLESLDFDELAADMGTEFVGNIVVEGLRRAHGIVALFTPDEFAALLPSLRTTHDAASDIKRWQSRPNVIFEAGIAFGIARDRSVLVTLGGEVSMFSDVAGIHILRLNNGVDARGKFRQKLIGMGCDIDQRTNSWTDPTKSGDFEACLAPLSGVSPRDPFP